MGGPKEETEFERHVESRDVAVEFHERDVVHAQLAVADQIADLLKADLTGIVEFQ